MSGVLERAVSASSFVGRDAELAEGERLLDATRLLTITGPGGAGKTRCALELARRAGDRFPDGVHVCLFAALRDPELVLATIARALEVSDEGGGSALELVGSRLEQSAPLLVLDNLEHLLEATPALSELLELCPSLTILATSRERLRLDGELVWDLPPLQDEDAVALFCERARVEPSRSVVELSRRLEGLPLAIELAAARMGVLSPEQLLARLSGRLDLLKGGRSADTRQQTLRATLEWSYGLLSDQERRLLRALSVFVGGCTIDAAEAVAGADLAALESLLDKSLLRRQDTELGPRFSMLETIREFAEERLEESGDAPALRERYVQYFTALGESLEAATETSEPDAMRALSGERANLVQALATAERSALPELQVRLAGATRRFWHNEGVREGRDLLERALGASEGQPRHVRIKVVMGAAMLAYRQRDDVRAEELWSEGAELYRAEGDPLRVAAALGNLGNVVGSRGDPERAQALFEESIRLCAGSASPVLGRSINGLGVLHLRQGNPALARLRFAESEQFARELSDQLQESIALVNLGLCALALDEPDAARAHFAASIARSLDIHDYLMVVNGIEGLAALAVADGDFARAAKLVGVAEARLEESGSLEPYFESLHGRTVDAVTEALGDDAAAERLLGRELALDAGIAYALQGAG